jgi:hypothetical protein
VSCALSPRIKGEGVSKPPAQLELQTDIHFQKTEWAAQRIGWMVWSLIVVAACLGLLGPGWLSDREVSSADGSVKVGYERFLHYHNPSQLTITCDARLDSDTFRISVQRSLLDRLQILRIDPEPEHYQTTADAILYEFQRDSRADAVKVVFHVQYDKYGNVLGDIALAGGATVSLRQFVYP